MSFNRYCFSRPLRILRRGFLLFVFLSPLAVAEEYLSTEAFLQQVFGSSVPAREKMWVSEEQRDVARNVIGLGRPPIRVHYWREGNRSAWILKEIGKEKPITIGVGINGGQVETVRILAFRESRGWEVKYPYFTEQFSGASTDHRIDKSRIINSGR